MKFKNLFLMGNALCLLGFLGSCSQNDEPAIDNFNEDAEMVEWQAAINLPEEFKTRNPASGFVGADGLYSFAREINRLWYAVYYNGSYLYDSEQPGTPDGIQKGDGFTVLFKFHKDIDPTQVYIFFWAGNKEDNVTCNNVTASDAININFLNRCVSVNPMYMNGNNTALQEYDSFAGYVQLAPDKEVSNYNMQVTLKRPFAQIHVLSDEFTFPGVKVAFPDGVTVVPGFGVNQASSANYSSNLVSPTTWFFDSSVSLSPAFRQNEYQYTLTNYEFTNRLSGSEPEQVTFKNRQMDYLGCYYVFAPIVKSPLKYAVSSGNNAILSKLNLAFRKPGQALSASEFAAVNLPSEGLQANNRYVVYNKLNTGDGDGGPGGNDGEGGGFVTSSYAFEVVTNPNWDGTEETQK